MDWQTWTALTIVAFATWRIALQSRAFFSSGEKAACGGCHACPSSSPEPSCEEFVALEIGLDDTKFEDCSLL